MGGYGSAFSERERDQRRQEGRPPVHSGWDDRPTRVMMHDGNGWGGSQVSACQQRARYPCDKARQSSVLTVTPETNNAGRGVGVFVGIDGIRLFQDEFPNGVSSTNQKPDNDDAQTSEPADKARGHVRAQSGQLGFTLCPLPLLNLL